MSSIPPVSGPIVKVELYRDVGRNRIIEVNTPVAGAAAGETEYVATVYSDIPTPRGPIQLPIRVVINAFDITAAFQQYDDQVAASLPALVEAKRGELLAHMQRLVDAEASAEAALAAATQAAATQDERSL